MIEFVVPSSVKTADLKRPKLFSLGFVFVTDHDGRQSGETNIIESDNPLVKSLVYVIVIRVPSNKAIYPSYFEGDGYISISDGIGNYIASLVLSREEALIFFLAHELWHVYQYCEHLECSDTEADKYAITMQRKWRKLHTLKETYPSLNLEVLQQ